MASDNDAMWKAMLSEGRPILDKGKALFSAIPADPRCMMCHSPFEGVGGRIMPILGKSQSREDPRFCNSCIKAGRKAPGGAEVEVATLFADMRGSTPTAERIGDRAFADLINRFFKASSTVLVQSGALLGRLAGDEAIGYFVPGMAGPEYAKAAISSAVELLRVTGHGDDAVPWIPLGVGVHAGHGYVGMVGNPGEVIEVTALGDDINIGARLADSAGEGEILASLTLCELAGIETDPLEHRLLNLKGKEKPFEVVVVKPTTPLNI